jgi:hypothetical protein
VECIGLVTTHCAPLAVPDTEIRSLEPENRHRLSPPCQVSADVDKRCIALRGELEALVRDAARWRQGRSARNSLSLSPLDASRAVLATCQALAAASAEWLTAPAADR